MNIVQKHLFKIRDLIAQLPVTNYPFLDNFAMNFVEFQTTKLQEILEERGVSAAILAVSQFAFKASVLTAFALTQKNLDFSDDEFVDVLELESIKQLELLKNGKFEEIFPDSFNKIKFDLKFHNLLLKAFDFMVIEFRDWSRITGLLKRITVKLDNHEQNFKSLKFTDWKQPPSISSVN